MRVLRGAEVWAPEPIGRADVVMGGGRILQLGPDLPPPPPRWDAEVIEVDGILVPGLVDVHVHLAGGGGEGGPHTRVPAVAVSSLTRSGVTTAVGLLGTDATTRSLGELLAAARALDRYGLTAFCYTGSYEVPPPTITGSVRGDLVHVDRMIAVGELAISDHRSSQPTFDELVRIAADAHVAGLMTGKAGLVHLHLGDGPRGLELLRRALRETELPARVFHPTHLNRNPRLWAEALELGSDGPWLDVSAFPVEDGDGAVASWDAVCEYLGAGLDPARLTVSSDAGGCLPTFDADGTLLKMDVGRPTGLLDTVRRCVAAGIGLDRALGPVTRNPATLFRLRGKGRIAVGGDADLVLLDRELQVRHVWAGGAWMVRDGVPVVRGMFEISGPGP